MSGKSIETINDRYYTGERPLFNKNKVTFKSITQYLEKVSRL